MGSLFTFHYLPSGLLVNEVTSCPVAEGPPSQWSACKNHRSVEQACGWELMIPLSLPYPDRLHPDLNIWEARAVPPLASAHDLYTLEPVCSVVIITTTEKFWFLRVVRFIGLKSNQWRNHFPTLTPFHSVRMLNKLSLSFFFPLWKKKYIYYIYICFKKHCPFLAITPTRPSRLHLNSSSEKRRILMLFKNQPLFWHIHKN